MLFSPFFLDLTLVLILVLSSTITAATAALAAPTKRQLEIYALYNIPPFRVTLTTKSTPEIQQQEGPLVESSLGYPLRTQTEDWLLDQFEFQISELELQSSPDFSEIYTHLVAVDLQTKLYIAGISDHPDEDDQERSNRNRKLEQVTLVTEMYGTVAFLEPHHHEDKPSNDEVWDLFGKWMDEFFTNHRDLYLKMLVQSDSQLLRDIVSLDVDTDISNEQDETPTTPYSEGLTTTESLLMATLVLLAFLALVLICIYYKKQANYATGKAVRHEEETFVIESGNSPRQRREPMDEVHHGGVIDALEASDRYLSKHRPDLFDLIPKGSNSSMTPPASKSPLPGSSNHSTRSAFSPVNENHISIIGRNYAIPSNPFEYVFGRSQPAPPAQSPKDLPPLRRPSTIRDRASSVEHLQMGNFASGTVQEDGLHPYAGTASTPKIDQNTSTASWDSMISGYAPVANIWRNVTNMWDDLSYRTYNQANHQSHIHVPEPHHAAPKFHDYPLPEEDETEYPFAFKDFPRHDGTPCLIYNDESDYQSSPSNRKIFVIASDDEADRSPPKPDEPVSDEAFQRMLSRQAMNDSFEEKDISENSEEEKEEEFKNKMNRILAQRHRQYEKRAIVEKHQEARRKERAELREIERRERQLAMEREIEAIEASLSPDQGYASRSGYPSHSHYSPSRRNGHLSPIINKYNTHSPRRRSGDSIISPKRSPYRLSGPNGIFRPATKYPNELDVKRNGSPSPPTIQSQCSSRSVSPPGGLEELDPSITNSASSVRQKLSSKFRRPMSVETNGYSRNQNHRNDAKHSIDPSTIEKLSVPPMGSNKQISPNSVMDDFPITGFRQTQQRTPKQDYRRQSGSPSDEKSFEEKWLEGGPDPPIRLSGQYQPSPSTSLFDDKHSRGSFGSGEKKHRRDHSGHMPPKGHHRVSSNSSMSSMSRGRSSHRRSNSSGQMVIPQVRSFSQGRHSRSNSHTDDVLLHGIYAQSRFV